MLGSYYGEMLKASKGRSTRTRDRCAHSRIATTVIDKTDGKPHCDTKIVMPRELNDLDGRRAVAERRKTELRRRPANGLSPMATSGHAHRKPRKSDAGGACSDMGPGDGEVAVSSRSLFGNARCQS